MSRGWWAERAWLGGNSLADGVLIEARDGNISSVQVGVTAPPPGATVFLGVTLPGFANSHSHAFHRALRGRTPLGANDFWTWRQRMLELAGRLDPQSYQALARAAYAEMALAGVVCVGEFHYVHHAPDGRPYHQANIMGEALVEAAREAGVRITVLDTCYLEDAISEPLSGTGRRFSDGDAESWASRIGAFQLPPGARLGAAIHSVRTVPPAQMGVVAAVAAERGLPLHVHLSEQIAENTACEARYGATPAALLEASGALSPRTCAVHATHVDARDISRLGASKVTVCACPTTERDLGDGLGPFGPLLAAGCPLAVGSDSNTVIDLLEEARGVELHERLRSGRRGLISPQTLLRALTEDGHRSLGWPEAGRIAVGAPCDLVAVGTDSQRLASVGTSDLLAAVVSLGATDDVRHVVVGGTTVVANGRHQLVDDMSSELRTTVQRLLRD